MKGSELHNVVTVTVLGKSLRVTCAFEIGPFKCSQVIEERSYLVIKSKEVEMVKNCDVLSVEMRQLVREIVRRKNIPDTLSLSLRPFTPDRNTRTSYCETGHHTKLIVSHHFVLGGRFMPSHNSPEYCIRKFPKEGMCSRG